MSKILKPGTVVVRYLDGAYTAWEVSPLIILDGVMLMRGALLVYSGDKNLIPIWDNEGTVNCEFYEVGKGDTVTNIPYPDFLLNVEIKEVKELYNRVGVWYEPTLPNQLCLGGFFVDTKTYDTKIYAGHHTHFAHGTDGNTFSDTLIKDTYPISVLHSSSMKHFFKGE